MAVENSQNDGQVEGEDIRRRALVRLGVAGVVTAAALAGLWWLDQGSKKPEKPPVAVLPAPIVTAPVQEAAPPQAEPGEAPPAAEPVAVPEPGAAVPATRLAAASPATASPAATSPSQPGRATEAPPPPKVSNVPKALSVPAAAPRAAPPPTAAQPPVQGERFMVQLGVFSNPDRARELVDKLNKQGIRAHLEARVHLGPFDNRQEAERAQVEMRKLGMPALVTPAHATK